MAIPKGKPTNRPAIIPDIRIFFVDIPILSLYCTVSSVLVELKFKIPEINFVLCVYPTPKWLLEE